LCSDDRSTAHLIVKIQSESAHFIRKFTLLVVNDVFLTHIVVVGSVSGQEGGLDPSKGGNGGGSFSVLVRRGVDAALALTLFGKEGTRKAQEIV